MKNFLNLNQLSMSWNEKQKPQRFRRYAVMLMMLLTLGVGQAWGWGWTKFESTSPATIYPGDQVTLQILLNGDGNGASYKAIGSGTTNAQANLTWNNSDTYYDYVEKDGDNHRWKFYFTPNSTGTWYWSIWLGWGSSVGDNGRYYNGSTSWNEGNGSYQSSSVTVSAVPKSGSLSAESAGTTSIALSWSKNSLNDDVIIFNGNSKTPSDGSTYTVGSNNVVYKGSGTSATITGLTANTSYTFYIYSIHQTKYYSASNNATAKTDDVATPAITLTSVSPASSIVAGNDITLVGTRANSSNAISFQYTTNDGSTWTDISPKTSSTVGNATTATWTVPDAHGATQTFKFRACLAADSKESAKSSGVTVYNTKTIHVKNTNNWGTLYLYAWDGSGAINGSWPGKTGDGINGFSCTNVGGGLWWDVTITSRATGFNLDQNVSGNANQTEDLSYGTYTNGRCLAIGTNSGKRTLSNTAASCLTDASVSTADAASILRTSATLGGSVSGNGNDKIISYGYYYTTNSALSSSNVIGTRVEVGTDNKSGAYTKSQTGLSANTTYYVMAYAKNGNGEAYGDVESFTTLAQYTVTTGVVTGQSARGSVSPASVTCSSAEWSSNVTASANAGYSFDAWTTGEGVTKQGSTSPTKVKATQNSTIKASFNEVMRTVSVVSNNTNFGNVSTASLTSVGPETKSAEVTATPETGATFTRWDVVSGITIADGYTNTSNPVKINATAAGKTLTAVFTETKHTVTLSTADGSKGTVGSNQSVGRITAVQITATPKSGYMFSKWVKTGGSGTVTYYTGAGNGQVEDASGEEKETTYITVTGNVTLQATWEPDRSSGYVVHYGNSGKNADGGSDPSQARDWKDGKLYRATTEASDVSYFTFTAGVGDVDKTIYFKIWETSSSAWDHWYGYKSNDGGKITGNVNEATLSTSYGDARLCITMPGNYVFTWNSDDKTLSVAYPTNVYYLRGGFNGWSWAHPMTETSSGVYSATVNMTEANHTYSGDDGFKLLIAGQYYGKNSTTVTRSTSTGSAAISGCGTSGANIGLTTDYTGDYTFTYTVASNTLQVTYPTAYKVTYGKGTINGSTGSCTAVDIDNSSAAVTSNSTWVKSGHRVVLTAPAAKSGYTYDGWFSNNAGTGDAITTAANCTTTVNASSITRYACYHENMTTVTLVASPTGKGSFTIGGAAATSTTVGVTTTRSVTAVPGTGYKLSGTIWSMDNSNITLSTTTSSPVTVTGCGTSGTSSTLTGTFTPITYTIHFNGNGNTSGSMSDQTGVTYDAATTITANAFAKTGYNFGGWATTQERANAGTVDRADEAAHGNLASTQGATAQLWAVWTPKQSALTFDYQSSAPGYGAGGSISAASSAAYGAAMPALSGSMPTAANGYAFMGFYSGVGGSGTQYYDGSGNSVHNWDVNTESTTTLYAYYKNAEITALTFDAGTVEPEATVGVTPTISPTPVGTTIICWTILHSNDTPLDPQPSMTWSDGKLTFAASTYSGTYKVQAVLRTGNDCSGGTSLDTETASFLVAGSHTVTVNYKCSSEVIKTATSVIGSPTDWSDDITAPDIFGYTFSSWSSADGVTIKDSEHEDVTSSTEATIKIKAIYAGSLTANYTQKQMIYFKNTLGWENVYVNFYTGSYWNNPKGSGNNGVTNQNLAMTQYGETDIWYYDYGAASITPSLYVSFTSKSQSNSENFWHTDGVDVVYPANYADNIHSDRAAENGFKAATPMFVPLAAQDYVLLNGKAHYYNAGYWSQYTPGTGYRLEIYNEAGNSMIKYKDFESADDLMPMKAVLDLEGGQTYKFQIRRGGESSAGIYYGNSGTMDYTNHGQDVAWDLTNYPSMSKAGITTNAAGDYTFNLSYSAYHNKSTDKDEYRLRIAVDYPVASGDYRLVYSDAVQTKPLTSAIVNKVDNGTDIVSFFVRPGSTPVLRIQQATVNPSTGAITWNEYPNSGTPTNQITGTIASTISSSGTEVYNFNLSMNGSGALTVASAEVYDGNFYIRTDAANSKWDNYRTDPDHRMTYSEYSIEHGGYTHYYCHWVDKDDVGRKNVKFVIANDYSPNITDTLARETASGTWANIASFMEEGGDLKRSANVRFMWDKRDNSISRAYVDGAQGDYSSNFLYMLNVEDGADKIRKSDKSALTDHKVTFKDNGNWMYEANIQAQPEAAIKLLSNWGTSNTITQYFRGASDATETLLGGSGSTWYDIRVIYDFKTNRLIAGLIPNGNIDDPMAIHADVMFIREHHGDIAQVTFTGDGAITDIETAYGVLQLNKWTINNKSKAEGHAPLSPLLSQYERDLFYISFPFRVSMEEVFGFGTYGTHWIIEYYDGATRASKGYWAESGPNWKFVTNRKGKYFEPGQGYIIALDLDEMGESADIWANTDQVELYFPSYGTMDNITSSTATYEIPEHLCTIDRSNEPKPGGGTLGDAYDRRVKDSHWNVLGVPTYVNPDAPTYANTDWITEATETSIGPNFLYEWNMDDNSVSAVSASGYTYHAMHAYLVQYCGDVTWTSSVSVAPSPIVARERTAPKNVEFKVELMQNEKAVDQTFVKLSDNEAVTTGFEFNYDMSKEFNKNRASIYTLIGTEQVAGNCLPLTEQTTVVPVGVKIVANGDYTFAIPDGTSGVGITLIDTENNIRTSLSALSYTVNLTAGTHDGRFLLEIAPIQQTPTDIEEVTGDGLQVTGVRKVLIDQKMYIIRDGKMYDARGAMIK